MDKVSYALGIGIGHQLANMGGSELNIDDFAQAVKDVLSGNDLKVRSSEAQRIVQEFFAAQEEKINKQRAEAGKAQKEAGEKYLAENAKKDGVIRKVTARSPLQRTALSVTMRDSSSTERCSTAVSSVASLPCLACSKSLQAGQKVFN